MNKECTYEQMNESKGENYIPHILLMSGYQILSSQQWPKMRLIHVHRRINRHIGPVSPYFAQVPLGLRSNIEYQAFIPGNATAAIFHTFYDMFTRGFLCRGDVHEATYVAEGSNWCTRGPLWVHARVNMVSYKRIVISFESWAVSSQST